MTLLSFFATVLSYFVVAETVVTKTKQIMLELELIGVKQKLLLLKLLSGE